MVSIFFAAAGRVDIDLHGLKEQMRQVNKEKKRLCRLARKDDARQKQLWHDAFVLYVLMDCDIAAPLALMDRFGPVPHEEARAYGSSVSGEASGLSGIIFLC